MKFWPCIIFATTVVKGYMQEHKARHNGHAILQIWQIINISSKFTVEKGCITLLGHYSSISLPVAFWPHIQYLLHRVCALIFQSVQLQVSLQCVCSMNQSIFLKFNWKACCCLSHNIPNVFFFLQNEIRRGKGSCMKRARFKCAARHIAYHKCRRAWVTRKPGPYKWKALLVRQCEIWWILQSWDAGPQPWAALHLMCHVLWASSQVLNSAGATPWKGGNHCPINKTEPVQRMCLFKNLQ